MENLELAKMANEILKGIVTAVHSAKAGHPGGSLSAADIFTYLYFEEDVYKRQIHTYIGKPDVSEADYQRILNLIASFDYDDYDRLIQLCDSIAMAEGPADIVTRMSDVKNRYGFYPQKQWDKHRCV